MTDLYSRMPSSPAPGNITLYMGKIVIKIAIKNIRHLNLLKRNIRPLYWSFCHCAFMLTGKTQFVAQNKLIWLPCQVRKLIEIRNDRYELLNIKQQNLFYLLETIRCPYAVRSKSTACFIAFFISCHCTQWGSCIQHTVTQLACQTLTNTHTCYSWQPPIMSNKRPAALQLQDRVHVRKNIMWAVKISTKQWKAGNKQKKQKKL